MPSPPYVSVKEEIHDYFRDHGTILDTDINAEMIDQIYEIYQQQRTTHFPDRGTACNFYKAEKSTWLYLFGKNALSEFPGINPGANTNWPAPPRAAIVRCSPAKAEVPTCPKCCTKSPKAPRRPRPPPNPPALEFPAYQPPSQQLSFSVPVGSSLKVNIAPSSYSSTMMDFSFYFNLAMLSRPRVLPMRRILMLMIRWNWIKGAGK
jgi:hypothetical protein